MEAINMILILGCLYCVFTDIKVRKIKNYITFPLILIGITYNIYSIGLAQGLVFSLKGAMICGGISLFLCAINGFGMGDVKLFVAIGAVKGPNFSISVLILSFFSCVILSFIMNPKRFVKGINNLYIMTKGILYNTPYKITEQESAWTFAYAVYIFVGLILTYIIGGDYLWTNFFIK